MSETCSLLTCCTQFCRLFDEAQTPGYTPPTTSLLQQFTNTVHVAGVTINDIATQDVFQTSLSPCFVSRWSCSTWCLLAMFQRCESLWERSAVDADKWWQAMQTINDMIIRLVNTAKPCLRTKCEAVPEQHKPAFDYFFEQFTLVLNIIHDVYTKLQQNEPISSELCEMLQSNTNLCLQRFRDFSDIQKGDNFIRNRQSQIRQSMTQSLDDEFEELVQRQNKTNAHLSYLLGNLAARLHGFRYEAVFVRNAFVMESDPVRPVFNTVADVCDWLMSDCITVIQPNQQQILVTNNLFPLACRSTIPGALVSSVDVHVENSDTAAAFQTEWRRAHELGTGIRWHETRDIATLAMKSPTHPNSATKRKAAADSRKKPDVSSRVQGSMLRIAHEIESGGCTFYAHTAHVICTTRDRKPTANHGDDLQSTGTCAHSGMREVFYMRFTATVYNIRGGVSQIHTLSLPFVIATRRNQDYQVQRMMSSYTATTFWLYHHGEVDGWLIKWPTDAMPWVKFWPALKLYFMVTAGVQRGPTENELNVIRRKIICDDCVNGNTTTDGLPQLVSLQNLLCPHLFCETSHHSLRFSLWRGILQLRQLFTEATVKDLWERHLLHGLLSSEQVTNILLRLETSAMLARLSFVNGGAVCVSFRSRSQEVIHLEPFDLKRLQNKSLMQHLQNIACMEKVRFIVNTNEEPIGLCPLLKAASVLQPDNQAQVIITNVEQAHSTQHQSRLSFVNTWHSMIACVPPNVRQQPASPTTATKTPTLDGLHVHPDQDFSAELKILMTKYGKSIMETVELLNNDDECACGKYLPAGAMMTGQGCGCTNCEHNT